VVEHFHLVTPMSRFGTAAALALVFLGAASAAQARSTHLPGDGVPESIRYYESVAMMSSAAPDTVGGAGETGGTTELSFYTLGRQFDLKLEASTVYAPGATVVWVDDAGVVEESPDSRETMYRGRVNGVRRSWVRLAVRNGALSGVIWTPGEMYFLDPAERFFGPEAAGETLAYRLSDTDSEWEPGSCAATSHGPSLKRRATRGAKNRPAHERLSAALGRLSAGVGGAASAAGLKRVELGMVADYEYFVRHGGNSASDIAAIVNAVDGIYQAEVGVTLEIVTTVVYSTTSDPFSGTLEPNPLLTEFSSFKNANDNNPGQLLYGVDLAHLMTGRDLSSTVIGIAWLEALCDSYYGAGLSQDYTTSMNLLTLLMAHEMGHNFAAPHDAQAGSACQSMPPDFIMNPVLSGSLQQKFSSCSKSLINPHVTSASCVDTAGPPAPLWLNALSGPVMVGAPLTLTGTGFTPGSVVVFYLATGAGVVVLGPYTPGPHGSTSLTLSQVDPSMPLSSGFVSVSIVNTDQNYIQSNGQGALVYGNPGSNIPTITKLNGVSLAAANPAVPLANVNTVLQPGQTVTVTGTGFNNPLVALYTASGNLGPLAPVGGWTSTQFQIVIPANAPTGPGAIEVVNGPYTGNVKSNTVSVPIGDAIHVTRVTQQGATITVEGTGFSTLTVISLFNLQPGGSVVNLGGLINGGQSKIPLNIVSSTLFTFQVPAGAYSGPAFIQALNPPFITAASSSGADPAGAFNIVVP
jgi:hypothetical protein